MSGKGPLSRIRHVCFDKDGTLTDLHTYWDHICRLRADCLCRKYGLDASRQDALLLSMGLDPATGRLKPGGPVGCLPRQAIVESVARGLAGEGVSALLEDIHGVFAEIDRRQQETGDDRAQLLPGVAKALGALKEAGVALSIYSSDRKENCVRVMARFGLGAHFSAVVGGGCVRKPKPDPEGFLTACRLVGVEPGDSAYVSDTAGDLRMARAGRAGAVIGVATGLATLAELGAVTPYVYADMKGVIE